MTDIIPWTLGDQLDKHPLRRFMGVVCPEAGGQRQSLETPGSSSLLEGEPATRVVGDAVPPGWQPRTERECLCHPFLSHIPISLPHAPEASNFVVTLLGWLVPVLVIVSAVTRECISRKRRR